MHNLHAPAGAGSDGANGLTGGSGGGYGGGDGGIGVGVPAPPPGGVGLPIPLGAATAAGGSVPVGMNNNNNDIPVSAATLEAAGLSSFGSNGTTNGHHEGGSRASPKEDERPRLDRTFKQEDTDTNFGM